LDIPSTDADAWNNGCHDVKEIRSMTRPLLIACALFAAMLCPCISWADGGVVRLHETQGPFIITVFTPQEILTGLPTDVSVLVQDAESSEVVMDANVTMSFSPPAGAVGGVEESWCGIHGDAFSQGETHPPNLVQATHAKASNKLLFAATVVLQGTGNWQMRATVQRGGVETGVACTLPVATRSSRLNGLWVYFAFPAVTIALFALNQWLIEQPESSRRFGAYEPQVVLK
jgi:hypothetical protein